MKIKGIIGAFILFCLLLANSVFAAEGKIPIDDARNCSAGAGAITLPGSYFLSDNIDNTDSSNGSCVAGNAIVVQSDHVTIDLMGHTINVSGAFDGIYANGYTDIEIRNGKIVNNTGGFAGIELTQPGGEFRITDVTVIGFSDYGIHIVSALACSDPRARAVVSNNNIVGGLKGINLNCAQSSRIEDNQVRGATDGIILQNTVDSIINNNISNQNNSGGIVVDMSNNLAITNNVVAKNANVGILIKSTNTSIISRNNASSNLGHGIQLDGSVGGAVSNMVTYNNASNNGGLNNGIFIDTGAAQNAIDWNVTSNNPGCGIKFTTAASVAGNVYSYNRSKTNGFGAYCDANPPGQNTNVVKTPASGGGPCPGIAATSTNE